MSPLTTIVTVSRKFTFGVDAAVIVPWPSIYSIFRFFVVSAVTTVTAVAWFYKN